MKKITIKILEALLCIIFSPFLVVVAVTIGVFAGAFFAIGSIISIFFFCIDAIMHLEDPNYNKDYQTHDE